MLLGDVNNILIFTDHVLISQKKKKKTFYGQMDNQWWSGWQYGTI